MVSSCTSHFSFPTFTQPFRSLPLNRGTQPGSGGLDACAKAIEDNSKKLMTVLLMVRSINRRASLVSFETGVSSEFTPAAEDNLIRRRFQLGASKRRPITATTSSGRPPDVWYRFPYSHFLLHCRRKIYKDKMALVI